MATSTGVGRFSGVLSTFERMDQGFQAGAATHRAINTTNVVYFCCPKTKCLSSPGTRLGNITHLCVSHFQTLTERACFITKFRAGAQIEQPSSACDTVSASPSAAPVTALFPRHTRGPAQLRARSYGMPYPCPVLLLRPYRSGRGRGGGCRGGDGGRCAVSSRACLPAAPHPVCDG